MNFKKRKIRPHSKNPDLNNSKQEVTDDLPLNTSKSTSNSLDSKKLKTLIFIIAIGTLGVLIFLFSSLLKSLDYSSIIFSFGKNLETDSSNKTNILLLGVGGEGHDGANLTDTIILASIDQQNKRIGMFSLPRDMYIKDKNNEGRINKVYDTHLNKYNSTTQGIEAIKNVVSEITGVKIQYAIKVDFKGFVKLIDALGGVNVVVEHDIYDPEYPKDGTILYEPFSIKKGPQHLDGKTALKYARSRHGNSGGGFGRSQRQLDLLIAMKEKALSLNLLSDTNRLQQLYSSLSQSIETDLSANEMIELAKIAKELPKENMSSRYLSDDHLSCGGFLYQPPRAQYGNAYVLRPAGHNYDQIQLMIQHYFDNFKLISENSSIQVLNGTKTNGLALVALNSLSRYCLNTVYFANAKSKDIEKTQIYYKPLENGEKPEALKLITTLIPAPVVEGIPLEYLENEKAANTTIAIELGKDYLQIRKPDPVDDLSYATPVKTQNSTSETNKSTTNTNSTTTNDTSTNTPTTNKEKEINKDENSNKNEKDSLTTE